jgi:trypsin
MHGFATKRLLDGFAAAFLAVSSLALLAAPAGADVVSSDVPQGPAEVRSFWTPERMQEAQPLGLPQQAGSPTFARPAAGSSADGSTIPASRGSALYDFQPGAETSFPQSVHGKLFFIVPANESHPTLLASCSGTVVSSRLQNVVFTAGHCAVDPGEEPSTNMVFVPGYRDGSEPFGEYPVATLLTTEEWATDGDLAFDAAIAQLSSPIEQTLGARGIAFNKAPKTSYKIFGYPAEPSDTYDGERLIECDAPLFGLEVGFSHPFSNVAFPCDMRQGASGGGWVNPAGDVVSVVSHGYIDPSLTDQIAGPFFGDAVKRLYNAAGGSAQCPPARQALKAAKGKARKARKLAKRSASRHAKHRLRKANRRLSKARDKRDNYC